MKKKTFKRGVHPYGGKELSMDKPIREIEASPTMVYPLSQHIGAPAKPVVAVGDRVLKGQLIAEAPSFVSAPIYSSVSGTVKAFEKRLVQNGSMADSIIIENDNLNEVVEGFGEERNLDDISREEISEKIKWAGIVGLGGAGFPTVVKLVPKNADDIDTLIINAAECEPYLTSDYRLILERTDDIIGGIKAELKLLPNAKAVIGIEDNKKKAIELLEQKTANEPKISVQPLKTKYPQGSERHLIYAVTKRKINSKMLPADACCVVSNVASSYAVYEAVCKGMPLIHRFMTVTGEAIADPCNVDVPIGVSHRDVFEKAGGAKDEIVKLISGGPMMGMSLPGLDIPVIKTSSSILAFTKDDVELEPTTPCIHCGKCVAACPEMLVPQMMAKAVKSEDYAQFLHLGGMECIECGSCAFVCPAKIPLVQLFKQGKAEGKALTSKK